MNFFEQELRRMTTGTDAFKSTKTIFIGRACFVPLSDGRRARIEFATGGVAERYEILSITILNVKEGKIDQIRLRFKDYFAAQNVGNTGTTIPHIWTDDRPEWYRTPTKVEMERLAKAAHDYIMLFA